MDPVTKSLIAAVQEVQEATYGSPKPEKKDTRLVVTAADKKANTKAYQNYKAGNKAYKAADHLKEAGKEPRWQDDDCDGKWYEKSDVDGKISKREKKAKEKAYAKEGFSNWRHDLKEIPDYEQIPASAKKRNEKISEKNVKNTVKINPEMKEETQVDEGVYEKQKTKEVMGALKKRDLKTSVKKKIAADIVKKKGDTSKSDDRYAYEGKTWEDIADELNESDIADIIARLEKKRISKGGNPDESPLGKKTGRAMKAKQDEVRKKAGVE